MTHDNQGKRWPPTAGVEADYITVEANGCGALAAERLRLHGIPHTTVFVGAAGRIARTPPVLEGWSFSVYSGAEEHASGWGSSSLADMAPALLAAVGMTDAATAHKRAQVAETRTIDLAGERDAAVEALDIANDMIGKLCAVMAGAGFDGDLLSAVGDLIESRNNAIKSRDSKQRELIEVRDALGPSRTADSVTVLAKRMRASLNRWEAVTRELAAGYPPPTIAVSVEDLADRHFDLRLALTNEVDRLKSVVSQAERMRAVLDRWQDLAVKHLPACPQLSHVLCGADLGTRHFELRGYMEGEINALRSRLSLAAEREDQTIAALGHPCSTNGIPAAVKEIVQREAKMREVFEARNHVTTELGAWRELGAALTGLDAHKATNDELREAVDTKICGDSHEIARLRDSLNARATGDALALTKPLRVALGWAERRDLSAERVVEAAVVAVTHSVAMSKEVTRLNAALENTGGYGAREVAKALRKENEALRNQVATLTAAVDGDLARSARVLAVVRTALETPDGECLADHAAQVLRRAKALDAWSRGKLNVSTGNTSVSDETLRKALDASHEMWDAEIQRTRDEAATLSKRLDAWQTWGLRAACVLNADDDALRMLIDRALPMWRRDTPRG